MSTVGYGRPHWLDEAFQGNPDTNDLLRAMGRTPRFKDAVEQARRAYRERAEQIAQSPSIRVDSPEQHARSVFMDALAAY